MVKKIVGIVLFIALLPFTVFTLLMVCQAFYWTQYLVTLVLFVPALGILSGLEILFWRMFRSRRAKKMRVENRTQPVRCASCGGLNPVDNQSGQCQYCFAKLRGATRI